MSVSSTLHNVAPQLFDLRPREVPEIVIERLTGLQLLAIDQQRTRARNRIAMFVEVTEQGEAAVLEFVVGPPKTGDIVVNQLRSRSIVTDNNEARRNPQPALLPLLVGFFVMSVKGVERRDERGGQRQRVQMLRLTATLLRHLTPNGLPKIPKRGHFSTRNVIGHRHTRQLNDAALDSVHQGEVAHHPGEKRRFGIA